MNLLLDIPPATFWNDANGSPSLTLKILVTIVVGCLLVFGLIQAPTTWRRGIVAGATFIAGAFYVALYLWPVPISRDPGDRPRNVVEGVSFWLSDAVPVVANFTGILSGFLLGLGVYSLFRVHGRKVMRQQKDWGFSLVLLLSMFAMVIFGYMDWLAKIGPDGPKLDLRENWTFANYGRDFLFEGLLQQMESAMFSVIAFYILSAAYRAFRVRTIEATILLAAAFIMMFSLLGTVEGAWGHLVNSSGDKDAFAQNFTLTEVARWIKNNIQQPSLRGIDFGAGIGALAMGLRLWLSLERTGGN